MKDIKKYIKQLTSSDFNRNVFLLFSGSGIAQAIPLIATVFLTRIYSEQAFGTFFLYSSIVMILSVISSLKLESTIVLSPDDQEAQQLFSLGFVISLITSLLFLMVIILFKPVISDILGLEGNDKWLLLIPVATLLNGFFKLSSNSLVRLKNYKRISLSNILKATTTTTYHLIVGFIQAISLHLIIGNIVGLISGCLNNFMKIRKAKFMIRPLSVSVAKKLLLQYKEFPIYNTTIGLSNTISNHIPILLLTAFFGLKIAGLYGLSLRVVGIPLGLLSQSYGQVFYREASIVYNNDKHALKAYVKKNYSYLFKIGIIPFIILFISSPFIFEILFGNNWTESGIYTSILSPWLFLMYLNTPMIRVFSIIRKQKKLLLYDLSLLFLRVVALYVGYKFFNDDMIAVALYALTGVLFNSFLIVYILNLKYDHT